MRSSIIFLTLLLALLATCDALTQCKGHCFVELARHLGKVENYAIICKPSAHVAIAVARRYIPTRAGYDTAGRGRAVERCFRARRERLAVQCNAASSEADFGRRVAGDMEACVDRPPMSAAERADNGPYVHPTENCTSRPAAIVDSPTRMLALWVCECMVDPFFEAGKTVARYTVTGMSKEKVRAHFDAVMKCSEQYRDEMTAVCLRKPGDYRILGLQKLATCCKRHFANSDDKFMCDKIVPGDLSDLKVEV